MKINESPELRENGEADLCEDCEKMRVECICPKCGKRHVVHFHWSGTGTPRKYCRKCRSSFN